MQNDLKKYFGVTAFIQNSVEKCLILTKDGDPPLLSPEHDMSIYSEVKQNYIKGYKASVIAILLNRYTTSPVICEVEDNSLYSIYLPADLKDEKALIDAFSGTGLRLHTEKREVKLMIISDGSSTIQRLPTTF